MNKIAINILIITTILMNSGCMTTEGVDYTPSNNQTDQYISISEHNFNKWLQNRNEIGGNKGFYGIGECPQGHSHEHSSRL